MSKDIQTLLIAIAGNLGIAVIGSALGILWYRATAKEKVDKDTIYFIIKLFSGIGLFGMIAYLIQKYL